MMSAPWAMISVSCAEAGAARQRAASVSSAARRANRMRVNLRASERLGVDRRAPLRVGRRAGTDGVEVRLAHLGGERAHRAVADGVAIDGEDRRDLGGGAGKERLVGDVELGAVDLALLHLDAKRLAEEREQGGA